MEKGSYLKTHEEMGLISVKQIGKSACGPTAIINVLAALDYPDIPTSEKLLEMVPARLRNYSTPSLSEYLLSRVKAGTIHEEIIDGIERVSKGEVTGKFFVVDSFADPQQFELWLEQVFSLKIAIMFTENLFLIGNDAWHHQMAYGVEKGMISLTNPIQQVPCQKVLKWISSGSWMIIPEDHILSRKLEEPEIEEFRKPCWELFNVLPQILKIKTKNQSGLTTDSPSLYSDLTIPYGGVGGMTLFCSKSNLEGMKFIQNYESKFKKLHLPFYEHSTEIIPLSLYEITQKLGVNKKLFKIKSLKK